MTDQIKPITTIIIKIYPDDNKVTIKGFENSNVRRIELALEAVIKEYSRLRQLEVNEQRRREQQEQRKAEDGGQG